MLPLGGKTKVLVINDISERQRDAETIKRLLRGYSASYALINASELRHRVLEHLALQKKKYDLILLGDRGGTLLLSSPELREFGAKIMRVPYSSHVMAREYAGGVSHKNLPPRLRDRLSSYLRKELQTLGESPRILVLEADVGEAGYTASKLAQLKLGILDTKGDARVDFVLGVANRGVLKGNRLKPKYISHPVGGDVVRLSELMSLKDLPMKLASIKEKVENEKGRRKALRALQRTQRYRALYTGMLPH